MKKVHTHKRVGPVTSVVLLAVATMTAFSLGIRSSDRGSVIESIMAGSEILAGDFDGNGTLSNDDVVIAVELSAGLRTPTVEELKADPSQDGYITARDTLWLMDQIKYAPTTAKIR